MLIKHLGLLLALCSSAFYFSVILMVYASMSITISPVSSETQEIFSKLQL